MTNHSTATADRLASAVLERGVLLDLTDVAAILNVSPQTARRMVASGEIPAVRLAGKAHRPLRVSSATLAQKIQGWTTR